MKIKGNLVKFITEIQDVGTKKLRMFIQIDDLEMEIEQDEIEKELTNPEIGKVEFSIKDLLAKK